MLNFPIFPIGSLGFTSIFDSDLHLPQLPKDENSKNKLVYHGSGNTSPNPGSAEKQTDRKPNYKIATRVSRLEFTKMYNNARKNKDWSELEAFYSNIFQNAGNICATFKKDLNQNGARLENPDLKEDLLNRYRVVHSNLPIHAYYYEWVNLNGPPCR